MASTLDSVRDALCTNPIANGLADVVNSFTERRAKLNLPNPGTVENIAKEVQRDVLLQGYMFSGLKADLTKMFSVSPLFQVSHQFAQSERMSPYNFAALYGTNNVRSSWSTMGMPPFPGANGLLSCRSSSKAR